MESLGKMVIRFAVKLKNKRKDIPSQAAVAGSPIEGVTGTSHRISTANCLPKAQTQ